MKKTKKSVDLARTSGCSPPKGKLLFFPAKPGFSLISGPAGSGKTAITLELVEKLDPATRCCCGHEYDGPTRQGRVNCCCEKCPGRGSQHTEHELGVSFDRYTDPDHPQYDRAFHAEVLAMGAKGVRPLRDGTVA